MSRLLSWVWQRPASLPTDWSLSEESGGARGGSTGLLYSGKCAVGAVPAGQSTGGSAGAAGGRAGMEGEDRAGLRQWEGGWGKPIGASGLEYEMIWFIPLGQFRGSLNIPYM